LSSKILSGYFFQSINVVHANNLGDRVIANRIFEVLAQNCSGLSQKAVELRKNFQQWRDESVLK